MSILKRLLIIPVVLLTILALFTFIIPIGYWIITGKAFMDRMVHIINKLT